MKSSGHCLVSRLTGKVRSVRSTWEIIPFIEQLKSFQLRDSWKDGIHRLASTGSDEATGIHCKRFFSFLVRKRRWKFHRGHVWSMVARHMKMIRHLLVEPFLNPHRSYRMPSRGFDNCYR